MCQHLLRQQLLLVMLLLLMLLLLLLLLEGTDTGQEHLLSQLRQASQLGQSRCHSYTEIDDDKSPHPELHKASRHLTQHFLCFFPAIN